MNLVRGSAQRSSFPEDLRYDGERVTYVVQDGLATPVHTTPFTGATLDDSVLVTDPTTCAPVP